MGWQIHRTMTGLGNERPVVLVVDDAHGSEEASPVGSPQQTALPDELPIDRWGTWEPVAPAPQLIRCRVDRQLEACSNAARRLVEAAAVLGEDAVLTTVGALAVVSEPLGALEEACLAGLLDQEQTRSPRLSFPDPLVEAAVYEQLGLAERRRLHVMAADLVADEGATLRHRASAAQRPDDRLAELLETYARRLQVAGDWAQAARALLEASRLSGRREQREQRLLNALNVLGDVGDAGHVSALGRDLQRIPPGPLRDATSGYLALLRGRRSEAHDLLRTSWSHCDPAGDPDVAAVVAHRLALHGVARLRGGEVAHWSRRALALARPDDLLRVESKALLGLGRCLLGRTPDEVAPVTRPDTGRVTTADGEPGVRVGPAPTAHVTRHAGSLRVAVWSYVLLARSGFLAGAWDAAAADATHAVSLLKDSGHEWLRPLARSTAVLVPAARGEWAAADEHARAAVAQSGDYELMVVAAALTRAHPAAARGDHDGVLGALEPVVGLSQREGVDEQGFWPWQDLYGDALVSAGRLAHAEAFLVPHEELAAARGRGSTVARLARVRGRLEAARGRMPAAEDAFRLGLAEVQRLPRPFQRALLELSYGQVLRRCGRRRAAAEQLKAARDRLTGLRARPYLERCEQELSACGLVPAKRSDFDPSRLTGQELAVARLVAVGMSNRQVASKLFISIKTVQFHLTHIYAKLGIGSRAELAARYRADADADADAGRAARGTHPHPSAVDRHA